MKTSKKIKSSAKTQETKIDKSIFVKIILWWIFKIVTFPFYVVYLLLFKIPTEGPAPIVGVLRFVFFVTIGMYLHEHHRIDYFMKDLTETQIWMPVSLSNIIMLFYYIIILWNTFLSFMEIWGLSTGGRWYNPFESAVSNSFSGYDAIEQGIDYRDTLLRANHTPGKIAELKKTGFLTKNRLAGLGSSPEVNDALELLNSQMRAMHSPDKLKTLKEMFGGK